MTDVLSEVGCEGILSFGNSVTVLALAIKGNCEISLGWHMSAKML